MVLKLNRLRVIPIHVPPVGATMRADRRLAFEVLTAFEAVDSLRVIEHEGDRWLIEFHTPYPWFGRVHDFVTIESVTLTKPSRIEFSLVKAGKGLALLEDRFTFEDVDGSTRFLYESTFGMSWSVVGWLFGKIVMEPLMKRHMRKHTAEVKAMIEARAEHSRVYPQRGTASRSEPSP